MLQRNGAQFEPPGWNLKIHMTSGYRFCTNNSCFLGHALASRRCSCACARLCASLTLALLSRIDVPHAPHAACHFPTPAAANLDTGRPSAPTRDKMSALSATSRYEAPLSVWKHRRSAPMSELTFCVSLFQGHKSRDCDMCRICGARGHKSWECPQKQ